MTTPILVFREVHGNDVYTIESAAFVTPSGSAGFRRIYRISREKVAKVAFTNALEAARAEPRYADPQPNDGPARLALLFPGLGSRKII